MEYSVHTYIQLKSKEKRRIATARKEVKDPDSIDIFPSHDVRGGRCESKNFRGEWVWHRQVSQRYSGTKVDLDFSLVYSKKMSVSECAVFRRTNLMVVESRNWGTRTGRKKKLVGLVTRSD